MDAKGLGRGGRSAIFVAVLAMHGALIGLLLLARVPRTRQASAQPAVQIVLLPPTRFPKRPLEISLPRLLGGNASIAVAPPTLTPSTPAFTPAASATASGEHAGVDWGAEARRALQSYEIRRRQPGADRALSGQPEDEYWVMHAERHPGDRFKTASGDWVVWINDDCYHVVSANAAAADQGIASRQIICRATPPPDPASLRQ